MNPPSTTVSLYHRKCRDDSLPLDIRYDVFDVVCTLFVNVYKFSSWRFTPSSLAY